MMQSFCIDLYNISFGCNSGEIVVYQCIVPRLVQQTGAVTGCIVMHLIGVSQNIKASQFDHS